ncbi:MAG: trypsin-like peptidase domain-containing protein [Candidatus Nitrohelix vancouverensis]|uniref:Serine protease n=1 Tax=Candidatus Nitrohelix vancouverensis TaxID=2705534 RepID=A0A7T0G484_9BACT|nr:MAG: trypsin-like peptidase domain-containing protein [Candidatus Nitrohelix vancouverensis]
MFKIIGGLAAIGCIAFLVFNTPVVRMGSGFLIGEGRYVITYNDLVKNASTLTVQFPNEDDIKATVFRQDADHNLAILKLENQPRVKFNKLTFHKPGMNAKNEVVFTLGYPWTNTMEDRHSLIEGSSQPDGSSIFIKINLPIDPVNSGSPLFNEKNEVIGMALTGKDMADYHSLPVPAHINFAIPVRFITPLLESSNISTDSPLSEKSPRDVFIENIRNNVVLIEAS